jgi:hypothetical protein
MIQRPHGYSSWPREKQNAWYSEHGSEEQTTPNGHDGGAQKLFELIPLAKISFDTAPAYLVKGIVPRVGLCVFWGPQMRQVISRLRLADARGTRLEILRPAGSARRRRLLCP